MNYPTVSGAGVYAYAYQNGFGIVSRWHGLELPAQGKPGGPGADTEGNTQSSE